MNDMNGTEIIIFLANNLQSVASVVGPVAGALFTAIFLRHNTKANEFEKIKAGQFEEVANDLLASGKMTYTEYYKANNFLKVAKKADEYYKKNYRNEKKDKERQPYDFDWFVRFFEAAGNVSDETMQNLWARILAGEIAQPSSFSLRVIDILRNMSKKDAELFVKVCSYSIKSSATNYFLPNEKNFLDDVGIRYVDIMKLSELGLMFNDGSITLSITINNEPQLLFNNDNLLLLISSSGHEEKVHISQYPFTEAGRELSNIVNKNISDGDFLKYAILLRNKGQNISAHRLIGKENDLIEYDKTNLIASKELTVNE